MWKKVPLVAAVLFLAACGSAPQVKYPSGSANRVPLNRPAVGTPLLAVASAPRMATVLPNVVPAVEVMPPAIAAEPPPEPIQLSVYLVNAADQSLVNVIRRWARKDRIDFTWVGYVDYPITERMRQIKATTLEDALTQVKETLVGVRVPLAISLDDTNGLVVQPGIVVAPVVATEEMPVAAAAVATAPVAPAAAGLSPSAAPLAAASAPATAVPTPTLGKWPVFDADDTLRAVVSRWAGLGGARLEWESHAVLPVSDAARNASYAGTLRDALAQLAASFSEVQTPIGMKFLNDGAVLRVYDIAEVK